MLSDLRQIQKDSTGSSFEVYVCPKGFSGKYRATIHRVWGSVTANKVKVDLYTHFLTDKEQRQTKSITLSKDQAVVEFDLADGRRTESLAEVQAVNAAVGHVALGQHLLAQQLSSGIDPTAALSLARARTTTDSSGTTSTSFPFIAARGAVGYQPQIQTLPEGASLMAIAVISADRRYVRFSGMPNFSGIGEVNTFNFANGNTGTSTGGTGGQGFGGLGGNTGTSGFGGGTSGFGGGNSFGGGGFF
jgi:hypothetical protein